MDSNVKPLTLVEVAEAAKKRVALISEEFQKGFDFLLQYPRSVTIFGSTRIPPEDPYFQKARDLAFRIADELHYSVLTGGGPGIMGAANKGAYEAGGNSLGLTIDLPKHQDTNPHLTDEINFHYFFSRKVCLSYSAEAYLFFPGGFGTLDEFSEVLTLVQTGRIPKVPVILVGVEFWQPMIDFFRNTMLKHGTIGEDDLALITMTDDEDEILKLIKESPVQLGVRYKGHFEKV
jgi:uncharacterized protein (TIGR00730 family)